MDRGRHTRAQQTRGEANVVTLVRDVVLERMMTSNRAKGFSFYSNVNMGISRGFLREAANRPDLVEGVRWLCLARTRAFPTVEGAWQRIKRSGQDPPFERYQCPLCKRALKHGFEWSHLLTTCQSPPVRQARATHLAQSLTYLTRVFAVRDAEIVDIAQIMGSEDGINMVEVVSTSLIGGLVRPLSMSNEEGWLDAYQIGFGGTRLITPGFDSFGFTYVASFFQRIAPMYVVRLGLSPSADRSSTGTDSESSLGSAVNQPAQWWTEGEDPVPRGMELDLEDPESD
jgi:hypothetical protein